MLKNYKGTKTYRRALTPFHLRGMRIPRSLHSQFPKNLIHAFSGHWPLFLLFFVDILAIFCTTMQISLRIRHSAPELCPMHLKNVVSARPEQTCIFHRLTRLLCCSVACIYNMPNKIPKRRFFKYFFSYNSVNLHSPSPDTGGKFPPDDDTASIARVYQAVMTADKRRRSRSVETWTGFPIPRTLLQPIISDGQLELFRVGNPPLTASLAAVSPSIDDGFEVKKDDENEPKFGAYEYFRASSTGEKPRPGL